MPNRKKVTEPDPQSGEDQQHAQAIEQAALNANQMAYLQQRVIQLGAEVLRLQRELEQATAQPEDDKES